MHKHLVNRRNILRYPQRLVREKHRAIPFEPSVPCSRWQRPSGGSAKRTVLLQRMVRPASARVAPRTSAQNRRSPSRGCRCSTPPAPRRPKSLPASGSPPPTDWWTSSHGRRTARSSHPRRRTPLTLYPSLSAAGPNRRTTRAGGTSTSPIVDIPTVSADGESLNTARLLASVRPKNQFFV